MTSRVIVWMYDVIYGTPFLFPSIEWSLSLCDVTLHRWEMEQRECALIVDVELGTLLRPGSAQVPAHHRVRLPVKALVTTTTEFQLLIMRKFI